MIGRSLVSLDLEMTSARPENQEIIEVAAVKFVGDRVVGTFSTLVSPPAPLPYSIQVLTGITPADLAKAPRIAQVAPRLQAFVGDSPLVAHTVSSDVGALARNGLVLANEQIDTFELASILLPRLDSYSLASLVRHFGIAHPRAHRALPDAQVTRQLFLRLVERALELDLAIVREIVEMTRGTMWPLKDFFAAVEAERSRHAGGSSIRDQLAAKMGAGEASLDAVLARERVEPIEPRTPRSPLVIADVGLRLAAGGPLARSVEGFEERPQQVEMARAVAEAFNDGHQLLAEAGTGTGKSLAYLVPAVEFARANGERVVVSTNTINLQEQLYVKDAPDLRRAVGDFEAAILKGRPNYLCFTRWSALRRRPDLSLAEILTLIKILVWLPQTETGDVGELNLTEAERAVWPRVNSNTEVCSPRRCAMAGKRGCFVQYARERAAGAHVVIVNHALLLSDAAVESKIIPDYKFLVVDEAHHLEDQATSQLGYSVSLRRVHEYLDGLSHTSPERRSGIANELAAHLRVSTAGPPVRKEIEGIAQELSRTVEASRTAATGFFNAALAFLKSQAGQSRGYDQRTRFTRGLRTRPGWEEIERTWEDLALRLVELQKPTEKLYTLLVSLEGQNILEYEALVGMVGGAVRFNEELRVQGAAIVSTSDQERIYWGSIAGGELSLHSTPLDVGPLLRAALFDQKEASVLTSATLTTGGDFTYVRGRLGVDEAHELKVGSPFDYATTTLLSLPTDMPEPDRPEYGAALARSLVEVCTASAGRALVLFTSHSQLRQTWQAIKGPLEARGILVLGHGVDGTPRRHLLQTFKTNPKTVLLGASSFWEGIDVVGEGLSVLAIAKLPFPVPTDPVFSARSELFDDPFGQYSLPSTILKLKQGFGRLIRSRSDRGVAICYDRRVLTKAYGAAVIQSLPPAQVRRQTLATLPPTVREWLRPPPT